MNGDIQSSLILVVILLLLSGFFSSAETSLVAVSRIRIRTLAEEGNHRAKLLLSIFAHEDKMLSAILIGNNLVNTWLASTAATLDARLDRGGARVDELCQRHGVCHVLLPDRKSVV